MVHLRTKTLPLVSLKALGLREGIHREALCTEASDGLSGRRKFESKEATRFSNGTSENCHSKSGLLLGFFGMSRAICHNSQLILITAMAPQQLHLRDGSNLHS